MLAGVAGLLAGAFSMGAGEYISMQSQRELFENQISIEREEMRVMPDVEEQELADIYRAKGLSEEDARKVAASLMEDPKKALDTKVREELGLDPDELGSPWGAAASSIVAFSVGAIVPLMPFLLTTGPAGARRRTGAFVRGTVRDRCRGQPGDRSRHALQRRAPGPDRSAAAAVTFGVGTLIGANIA